MLQLVDVVASVSVIETLILFLYAMRYYVFSFVSLRKSPRNDPATAPRDRKAQSFVSILLPIYNEANVVDRLMACCTSFDFPDYEVVVIDDSTDGTTTKLEAWRDHPRVTIVHRAAREGWKGGALNVGLAHVDAKSTHTLVLDADFVPPADLLYRFLARFPDGVAAVQGYQVHDLNAEENWITKGVQVMHSLQYLVELRAKERLGLLLPLTGSVFMVRTDVIKELGFNGSITEDWEFTLRFYEAGYKVVYDSTLTASAECSNSLRKFLRQIARWGEGGTRDFRQHFGKMMRSSVLSAREKLDFLLHGSTYLNAILILALTIGGISALPSVTYSLSLSSTLSSLLFTAINLSSLVFATTIALIHENLAKDVVHIPYLLILGYLATPVVAYASLKGLLMGHGSFHRTYKTGNVTKSSIMHRLRDVFKK
jgi:cellulose synthase/poly-beta-1,6-N-acetylglucosamine synthase-like glycosyltransferase